MPAPTIDEITLADEPVAWEALGFAVTGDSCRLGDVTVRLTGKGSERGILSWSLRDLQDVDLDGLPTSISTRPPQPPGAEHPNGVLGIDHVVAMSPDFGRSVARIQDAGLDLRRVRELPTPAGAPRQAFFRLGREILELVEEPEEIVARAGGPDRPVRFWGLALIAPGLEFAPTGLGAKELDGLQELRPFALQGLPAGSV